MFSALLLLDAFYAYPVDVTVALLATVAGCAVARSYVRTRSAGSKLPLRWCAAAVASVTIAGAIGQILMSATPGSATPLLVGVRLFALAGGTVTAALLLVAGSRGAVLRGRLRAHANVQQQLRHAKDAADEASRAKSDFLAVMSHEMRTPLNAVTGFATLLRETKLDDTQREYVQTIAGEAARLATLINDILDLTKIEEGRLTLERLPFAPVESAHEILRLLQTKAAEKKLDLRFEAQTVGPLLVAGDPLRFRQVLLNLVDNAIKFTPNGSVTLFLTWHAPASAGGVGELGVRVIDTGIGIPEEKLLHLFQMFMQADTSTTRRYGGTGLGLAICQRLVKMMGGEIIARSTVGAGSEFSFLLPVMPVSPPVESIATEPPLPAPYGRRPRVLVVDDMETNRFLLEVFLRRNGFDPELASGGQEAVELASRTPYDAILMDLQMPDVDGYTAVRRIRAAETSGRHTPILALTASIARGTREKCLAAGMDEQLTKPLDLRRFKQILDHLIPSEPPAQGSTPI